MTLLPSQITNSQRHGKADAMDWESVECQGRLHAVVIWATARVEQTTFLSAPSSTMQFGLLAHESGFDEPPHYHAVVERVVSTRHQMFVMQRGIVEVSLYSDDKRLLRKVILKTGDAIILADGIHAIRVIEEFQAITVKQGPYMGEPFDKQFVEVEVEVEK